MWVRRLHSISPGTAELNMGPQPLRVQLHVPRVPFATLQNHVARVSLPTVPRVHGDPGAPTPPSQVSPQRCRSPQKAMGRAWTRLLHSERVSLHLQDAQSHWVSAASHFPATCGLEAGERTFLHGEQSSAQTAASESRSCRTPTQERPGP